ncbi:LysM peptidoglycan-binding domain-containing protein [Oligoflexus tunisiensis]|uniref:LysM peptidoglycan-binding domain-containing protein n=1 Tax=Oligoflexus tunisiensis TaxID=708132 RepID=UPI00114D0A16|nr:LysM peptidoglycan-binding domain-containing protein [Oligoflexus tunisiensis]
MRTFRRFYTGLALSALILASNCTLSDNSELEDLDAADAGDQVVEVQQNEITDSEIPAGDGPETTDAAGESIDGNSSSAIQDLNVEQQAEHKGPELPEMEPVDAQPVSDVEAAAAQTESLPSLSQVVAESDGSAAAQPYGQDMVSATDSSMESATVDAGTDTAEAPAEVRRPKVRKSSSPAGMEDLSGNFYIVQPGDTLGRISSMLYGTSRRWQEIAAANNLEANSPIYPGDVLRYPADAASAEYEAAYKNLSRSQIVVQKGDTLEAIAERQFGNKAFWKLLWRWNESIIAEPNRIFEGQSIECVEPEELAALLSDRKGLKAAH